jgi:hypothetical protein
MDQARHPAQADLRWFLGQSRPRRLRTMRQFAEQEIVIPEGPFQGRKFRCARQPYTGLWFDAVDSGIWNRYVATGPTQSGKTLSCFVIPMLYHLFELGETVICGLPDMDMAGDKWREDIFVLASAAGFDLAALFGAAFTLVDFLGAVLVVFFMVILLGLAMESCHQQDQPNGRTTTQLPLFGDDIQR